VLIFEWSNLVIGIFIHFPTMKFQYTFLVNHDQEVNKTFNRRILKFKDFVLAVKWFSIHALEIV